MALWKDAANGQPSWLLSGTDGVNGTNEVALVDDEKGVGWRIWHAKEAGQAGGQGRGWWEILATQDVDGGHVDMGGPVLGAVTVPSLTGEVTTDVTIQLSATDPDGSVVTYAATAGAGLGGIAIDGATGLVTITAAQLTGQPTASGQPDSTHVFTWTATAGGVTTTSGDVTITVTAPA